MVAAVPDRDGAQACGRRPLNPRWRSLFLESLAESSNVSQSARRAGIDPARAYRARRQEPQFAEQWLAALWEGYVHLEMEVLRRLREGDQKAKDAQRYDFANAIRLLAAHRSTALEAGARNRDISAAEVRASIDRKVDEIKRRLQTRTPKGAGGE